MQGRVAVSAGGFFGGFNTYAWLAAVNNALLGLAVSVMLKVRSSSGNGEADRQQSLRASNTLNHPTHPRSASITLYPPPCFNPHVIPRHAVGRQHDLRARSGNLEIHFVVMRSKGARDIGRQSFYPPPSRPRHAPAIQCIQIVLVTGVAEVVFDIAKPTIYGYIGIFIVLVCVFMYKVAPQWCEGEEPGMPTIATFLPCRAVTLATPVAFDGSHPLSPVSASDPFYRRCRDRIRRGCCPHRATHHQYAARGPLPSPWRRRRRDHLWRCRGGTVRRRPERDSAQPGG